jgi:hypothetical protein
MKDNEHSWKDKHNQQMVTFTEEVAQVMEIKFSNEADKLRNNEQNEKLQNNLDHIYEELLTRIEDLHSEQELRTDELRVNVLDLHKRQDILKTEEHNEGTRIQKHSHTTTTSFKGELEEFLHEFFLFNTAERDETYVFEQKMWETSDHKIQDLRLDVEQLNNKQSMEHMMMKLGQDLEELCFEFHTLKVVECRDNIVLEHSVEEKLESSVTPLLGLWKEFDQFKDNQFSERTDQQARSLLGQMVETLGHLVEKQTKFFDNILP